MRCITRNYICWSHREVVGTTAHSNSLLLLSSKCKLDVIRTLSVYLLLFCANLQEQQEEKRLVWCSSLFFWVFFFLRTHSLYFWRFFFQPPRRFSTSFFIISLSVWTFCLAKFLWGFLCSLSSRHPWGSASCDAHELVALWLLDVTHDPRHKLPLLSGHSHVMTRRLCPPEKDSIVFFFCKMIIISFYVRIFLIKWPFVGWCGQFGIWTNFNIKESGLASIVTTRPNSNHTGVWPTFLSHLSHLQHWQHCIISLRAYTRIRPFLLSICTFLYPITPLDFRQDPAAAKIEFSHPARYWPRLITLSHMLINCFQVKKWLAAILKLFRRWVKVAVSSWSRCFCVVFEGQQKLVNLSATAEPVFWKLWQMAVKNVFNFFAPARWRLVQPS